MFFPPATTEVQGIPGAWEDCRWLIDQQHYFQLEFFKFLTLKPAQKPADLSPADTGYNMIAIVVKDFGDTIEQAIHSSTLPIAA